MIVKGGMDDRQNENFHYNLKIRNGGKKNMSISKIGNHYSYIYNSQTGKLSTKDGTEDAFVSYFNGDISGKESDTLNGFDAKRKRDIQNMIMLFSSGKTKNIFDNADNNEYEISGEIVDAVTSNYSVNGEKVFTAYDAVSYTYDEVNAFSTITQPYKTRQSKGYDPADNSINIAVGDVFDFGNGYKLTVKEDCIYGEGYGKGSVENDKKMNQLVWGLNALIHFADQQWFAGMIDKESTPMLLELLKELGVDTDREFIINGTKCEVVNGRIREVGNDHVVPSSIYHQAVKRYEELLYRPLSEYK